MVLSPLFSRYLQTSNLPGKQNIISGLKRLKTGFRLNRVSKYMFGTSVEDALEKDVGDATWSFWFLIDDGMRSQRV